MKKLLKILQYVPGYAPMLAIYGMVQNQPNYLGEYDNVIDNNDRVYMGFCRSWKLYKVSVLLRKWKIGIYFLSGVARTSRWWSDFHPFDYPLYMDFKVYCRGQMDRRNQNVNAKYPVWQLRITINNDRKLPVSGWETDTPVKNAEVNIRIRTWDYILGGSICWLFLHLNIGILKWRRNGLKIFHLESFSI